ncbi:LPXTG-motif cell wall anchor domain-containing protein [Streptococcus henryi]|uniref:LPXTG-motif cell wall anchor domain-containing protein n=1 Tax=Streptococcus henryi TaxID=439219 RepID=A0A1G6A1W8_9STRE|nr:LPXTG-motif cell wall anchor domain-containing protein [Streptococcus henryi]
MDGSSNALTGAKFRLYDAASNGNEIKVVKNADGTYRVAEAGETGVDIDAGTAVVKGLKGLETYHLEETKAPDGYNILTARQAVKLVDANDATKAADATVTVKNNKGTALPSTGSFGTTMFYLAGSVLLVGALVYMISKRRMNNI